MVLSLVSLVFNGFGDIPGDREVPEQLWERLLQADADEDGAITANELAEPRREAGDGFRHGRGLGGHQRHYRR